MNCSSFRIRVLSVVFCWALMVLLPVPCQTAAAEAEESFTLTFVGDCTFGGLASNQNTESGFTKTVGEDYGYPFRQVQTYFQEDEATFLNLEGPLYDGKSPVGKRYVFRGPTAYGAILTENSVEAVSVANNHTHDHGQKGYESTLAVLEELGIPSARKNESTLFETANGLTIGLYGAVYDRLDEQTIVADIQALAAQKPDVLIFAPHWGTEGAYRPRPSQVKLAYVAIDAGADIVWGSHPHVLQPVEHYNGSVIFYSLGNFSFGGNGSPGDYDTALIQQEICRDAQGNITLGETTLVPCCISGNDWRNDFQPVPYVPGSKDYERTMEKLNGTWRISHIPIS